MRCPNCQADNPDDNALCAECGARLHPAEPPRDQEPGAGPAEVPPAPTRREREAQQALDEAFRLSDQDRVAEAIAACQHAVALDPESVAAYSLLGILHERAGQREQAIRAYEEALRRSPEGPLDRETLRQLIARPRAEAPPAEVEEPPAPLRRRGIPPIWYGVVAAAVVLVVLVALTVRAWRGLGAPEPQVPPPPSAITPAPPPPPPAPAPPPVRAEALPAPRLPPRILEPAAPPQVRPPVAPTRPPAPEVARVAPPPSPALRPSVLPTPPPPIELVPPAEPAPSLEAARERYFEGDLEGAISAYEGVTAADAEPAAWQELGLLYYQAGRKQEAAAAYRQALDLYREQIEADQEAEAARHGLRTVRAALAALDLE